MDLIVDEPLPLIKGDALSSLVEKLRSKLESDKARLLAKGRKLNVRVSEYISAQRGDDIKDAIRWLLGERNWRYVSFSEFIGVLGSVVDRLHNEVYSKNGPKRNVCFVVDSFNKSSFWVIMMAMLMRSFPNASLAIDDYGVLRRRSLNFTFGDDEDSLLLAFRGLPDDTKLVLMDDAAYSGEQLSYFHDVVVSQWRASRKSKKRSKASVSVVLPFISRPATQLFVRRGTDLIFGETFPGLFDERTPAQVLRGDLFLEVESEGRKNSPLDKYVGSKNKNENKNSYASLFFDVIGVLPTNTMFIFEHKIGDSLSIPNRWLKVGQCVPPGVSIAYRVKREKAKELVAIIRKDLISKGQLANKRIDDGPWTPSYRLMLLVSSSIREMLSNSEEFKKEFFDRVDIPTDEGKPAAFLPLISPEFCDAPYRRYVRSHRVEKGKLGLALPNSGDAIPPCRRPPYKRSSFRRRIVL